MKAAINKEQSAELRKFMEKLRVPKETIDILLSSTHASNTHKAFRMKKQISTSDGWQIHFGANWARRTDTPEAKTVTKAAPSQAPAQNDASESPSDDVKSIGEDFLSRTFMGLAEKLKRLQAEDVDKPMKKIVFEVSHEQLEKLRQRAAAENSTVGSLIRIAISKYVGS